MKFNFQGAGLTAGFARSIGIAVDPRRRNKSVESRQQNVQRLKEYRGKLILFPINEKKLRKGEATEEERKVATQLKGTVMPIVKPVPVIESRKITDAEKKFSVFGCLRQVIIFKIFFIDFWNLINAFILLQARSDARMVGIRAKRLKDLTDNPEDIAKAASGKDAKKAKK